MKINDILSEDHGYGYYVKKNGKKKWVADKKSADKEADKLKKECQKSVKVEKDKD